MERHRAHGFDALVCNDADEFSQRCRDAFGFPIDPQPGTRKSCEFDPAFGEIFADRIAGYDFWGQINLDAVYGRIERWITPEFLADCDIFGNDPNSICGPFSIYRAVPAVRRLYRSTPGWERIFKSHEYHGFDEGAFAERVVEASKFDGLRFKSAFWQSHDKQWGHHAKPQMELRTGGVLWDRVREAEVMMFHFNRSREWPV